MPRAKTPEETHAIKISVSFNRQQYDQLMEYCQRNDRSIAWVIRKALEQWLPAHKEDHV